MQVDEATHVEHVIQSTDSTITTLMYFSW